MPTPLNTTRKSPTPQRNTGVCESDPWGMVLYGLSGVGKSSLAAEFPDTAFVIDEQERGIKDLVSRGEAKRPTDILEVDGWQHLLNTTEKLCSRRDIRNVAYDSLYGMEQLCFQYHCKTYFDDDWTNQGFYSFQQGPKNAAKRDWPDLISAWENLRLAGKNVIVIAHSQVKVFQNPDGPDFDRFSVALDKETWAATHRWAPMVLFYRLVFEVKKEGPKSKAQTGTERRIICCTPSSVYDAKNRYGLPPIINAGDSSESAYQAFVKAFNKV